uniref:Uncharacterized protein n=1 Tax=Astyanax mexicanus TaxID=7994 RepID=A0A8B9GU31_ASTMX
KRMHPGFMQILSSIYSKGLSGMSSPDYNTSQSPVLIPIQYLWEQLGQQLQQPTSVEQDLQAQLQHLWVNVLQYNILSITQDRNTLRLFNFI